MEQRPLYDSINFGSPFVAIVDITSFGVNVTAAKTVVATFICPSDSLSIPKPYAPANYRVNIGTCGLCSGSGAPRSIHDFSDSDDTGAFTWHGSPLSDFIDGTSNTLAFSEKLTGSQSTYFPPRDWLSADNDPAFGNRLLPPPAWVALCSNQVSAEYAILDAGRTWLIGRIGFTSFTTGVPPNSSIPDCGISGSGGGGIFAARSLHPGGVNAAMMDGSVRFVRNGIEPQTWMALGTRSGREVFEPDF
jgi:prepilin-type processing-associated H-X9-DG protein